MIAMLEKDPKLRFTNNNIVGTRISPNKTIGANTIGFIDGELCWINPMGERFSLFRINTESFADDWTIVRQPVTWQEALQAWADGKTVKWHYPPNKEGMISKTFYPSCIGPTREALLTGTWYILEDTADA